MGVIFFTVQLLALGVLAALLVARLRAGTPSVAPEERTAAIAHLVAQIAALEEPRGPCAGARTHRRSRVRGRRSAGRT